MSLNQLIDNNSATDSRPWLNVKVHNINIVEALKLNGDAGADGEIITNIGGEPVWSKIVPPSLDPGNPDTFLNTSSSGAVSWFNMTEYISSYYLDSTATLGNSGAYSALPVSGTQYSSPIVSFNSGTQVFTIGKEGMFNTSMSIQIVQDASPRGQLKINILKNGVDLFPSNYVTSESGLDTSFLQRFNIGDTLEFQQAGIGLLQPQSVYDEISYISFRFIGV